MVNLVITYAAENVRNVSLCIEAVELGGLNDGRNPDEGFATGGLADAGFPPA
jgi:hypothetical protein